MLVNKCADKCAAPTGGKGVHRYYEYTMVTKGRKGSDVQPGRRHRCKMKKYKWWKKPYGP